MRNLSLEEDDLDEDVLEDNLNEDEDNLDDDLDGFNHQIINCHKSTDDYFAIETFVNIQAKIMLMKIFGCWGSPTKTRMKLWTFVCNEEYSDDDNYDAEKIIGQDECWLWWRIWWKMTMITMKFGLAWWWSWWSWRWWSWWCDRTNIESISAFHKIYPGPQSHPAGNYISNF